jgi:hypothetical protein
VRGLGDQRPEEYLLSRDAQASNSAEIVRDCEVEIKVKKRESQLDPDVEPEDE